MNRRDLIQRVVMGGAVLILSPTVLNSCSKDSTTDPDEDDPKPTEIDLDLSKPENSALNSDGGSLIVQDIIVINIGGGNYSALSKICTHQGCTVAYNTGANQVQCPCHGSAFATSGSVVNGPATSALKSYPVVLNGNILTITA